MPAPQPPNPNFARDRIRAYAALATALTIAVLLVTSPLLPLTWDEGNAILRAQGIGNWCSRWWGGAADGRAPWSREALADDWQYTTKIEGHPALYGIVIAAGARASSAFLNPLEAQRFGPICLFGVAAGLMCYRLAREYSPRAGVSAAAALLLLPRLFAHAHCASFDGPLTSCWVLSWATFAPALDKKRWACVWGAALGLTLAAKFTGWIAPAAFLGWAVASRDRRALRTFLIGIPVALAVFYLLNPPLWHAPLDGLAQFWRLNLQRRFNIPTQFLGQMYDLDHKLPWYNTLFWTAFTVPVGLLPLLLVGLVTAGRSPPPNRAGWLLVSNWLALIVVRALPIAPPHDAERLVLPSFAFLAALVGLGTHTLVQRWSWGWVRFERLRQAASPLLLLILYAGSASSLIWYAPQWLSYYNLLIGGLPGATRCGMEPTYYWDALDDEVRDWLEAHTAPDERVCLADFPEENLALLRVWGLLQVEVLPQAPGRYRWYVLQLRPSMWKAADRRLLEQAVPAYQKTIRPGGWGPWRLDVPLLNVYSYDDYLRARETTPN